MIMVLIQKRICKLIDLMEICMKKLDFFSPVEENRREVAAIVYVSAVI
jgi:hypothetical protein